MEESPLEEFKQQYAAAVEQSDADMLIDAVCRAWSYLADNSTEVNPLFSDSLSVMPIIRQFSLKLLQLERWTRGHGFGAGSGGNLFLQGVNGVGKTTIMKGLCAAVGNLSTSVIPVFADYQTGGHQTPYELVNAAVARPNPPQAATMNGLLDALGEKPKRAIVFFADEVQTLYIDNAQRESPQCNIILQLSIIGKQNNSLGVFAGSTSALRDLAFRHRPDHFRSKDPYANYCDLNDSVFVVNRVDPLRTSKEVKGVLLKHAEHCKLPPPTDERVESIFAMTGGVGRLIDNAKLLPNPPCPDVTTFLEQYETDPNFQAVISRLFVLNNGLLSTGEYNLWNQTKLSLSEAAHLVQSDRGILQLVHTWMDARLIHMKSTSLEFFCCAQYEALKSYLDRPTEPIHLLQLAVRATLGGWQGRGYAGAVVEAYLLQRYAECNELGNEPRKITFRKTGKSDEKQVALDTGDTPGDHLNTSIRLEDLVGKVCRLSSDKPMHGFVLSLEEDNRFSVEVVQVKVGEHGKSISAPFMLGKIVMDAQRAVKDFRKNIASLFKESCPRLTFGLFTLVTTKTLASRFPETVELAEGSRVPLNAVAGQDCFDLMDSQMFRLAMSLKR